MQQPQSYLLRIPKPAVGLFVPAAIAISVVASAFTFSLPPSEIEVVFLDVGQGDAILIRSPEGRAALVDAGRGWIVGQLNVHDVDTLDLAIGAVPNAQHVGGMIEVVRKFTVLGYMDNGAAQADALHADLAEVIEESHITYVPPKDTTIALGSISLTVLPPAPSETASLGLLIEYGEFKMLLTGDARTNELDHFVTLGVPRVTVLKASNHGDADGVSADWLAATQPAVVVISTGVDNAFGHPHESALRYYKSVAREIYRTDLHGEITIRGRTDGTYHVRTVRGNRLARAVGTGDERSALEAPESESSGGVSVWVYPDAFGYDQFNLNGEYAVVKNSSPATIDLSGWQLCNFARYCYEFPTPSSIPSQDSVFVFSGVGHTHGSEFYQAHTRSVWGNQTDVATLLDRSGHVIARYAY